MTTTYTIAGETITEHTYANEQAAHVARRTMIEHGAQTSLIGYDGSRGVYAFDVSTTGNRS
jgi:hypothetical protein